MPYLARAAPSASDPPGCTASGLDWALIVLSLTLISLTWWTLEIPDLVFKKPNYDAVSASSGPMRAGRFWRFFRAITWNCTRTLMPSYVAVIAMARNRDPKAWPRLYYFGHEPNSDDLALQPFSAWEWAKAAGPDLAHVVTQALLIYRGSTAIHDQDVPLNYGMWLFTSTPGPIVGLYLLVLPYLRIKMWAGRAIIGGIILLSASGLAFCLTVFYETTLRSLGPGFGAALAYGWACTMLPFPLSRCCGGLFHFFYYVMSASLRAAPLLIDLAREPRDMPYCTRVLHHPAFIAIYAIFGWMLMMFFGYTGSAHCETFRPQLHKLSQVPRTNNGDARNEDELAILETAARASARFGEPGGGNTESSDASRG